MCLSLKMHATEEENTVNVYFVSICDVKWKLYQEFGTDRILAMARERA